MSTTTKVKLSYAEALALAEDIRARLEPGCERIELAGSIRRQKPEIGDIEIVAIPKLIECRDLFGNLRSSLSILDGILSQMLIGLDQWRAVKAGQWYKQFDIGRCTLDLFITTPEKWGCVYTIRTGSADFTQRMVTKRRIGGLCPAFLRFQDGRIWNGDRVLDTPEETDVFQALGVAWIPPEERVK